MVHFADLIGMGQVTNKEMIRRSCGSLSEPPLSIGHLFNAASADVSSHKNVPNTMYHKLSYL